jgi:hypothetical protein
MPASNNGHKMIGSNGEESFYNLATTSGTKYLDTEKEIQTETTTYDIAKNGSMHNREVKLQTRSALLVVEGGTADGDVPDFC